MQHTRLLITLSNLRHLNQTLIPGMLRQLESAFNINVAEDRDVS